MTVRASLAAVLLLAACAIGSADESTKPARVADDFTIDSLKDYRKKGEVAWEKGQVTLKPAAGLTRELPRWATRLTARFIVALPAGPMESAVTLRIQGAPTGSKEWEVVDNNRGHSEVVLLRSGDGFKLIGQPDGSGAKLDEVFLNLLHSRSIREEVALPAPKAGAAAVWVVRLDYQTGLLRAKVWPQGDPEPAAWQSIRYAGHVPQTLASFTIGAGKDSGAVVKSLELTGTIHEDKPVPRELEAKMQKGFQLMADAARLQESGKFREAVAKYREAQQITAEVTGRKEDAQVVAASLIAQALYSQGDLEGARRASEEGVAANARILGEDHPDTFLDLAYHGRMLERLGDLPAARRALERAESQIIRVFGPSAKEVAEVNFPLGMVLLQLDDLPAARRVFEDGLKVQEAVYGKGHPFTGGFITSLGHVARRLGDHAKARDHFQQALDLTKAYRGKDHTDEATGLVNLASVLVYLGEEKTARQHLTDALAILQKRHGKDHPLTAKCQLYLGTLSLLAGDAEAARTEMEASLGSLTRRLSSEHADVAEARCRLGLVLAAAGDRRAAWAAYREGTAGFTRLTARLLTANAERDHAAIVARWRPEFEAMLAVAEQDGDVAREFGPGLLASVWDWKSVSGRAVIDLRRALNLTGDKETARLHDEVRFAHQRLVRYLMEDLASAGGRPDPARRQKLVEEHARLERQLAERVEGYESLREGQRAGPARVAAHLSHGSALVEMVRYRAPDFRARALPYVWREPRYAAVVLGPAAAEGQAPYVRVVFLGEAGPIEKAVTDWRTAVQKGTVPAEADEQLRKLLWTPLKTALPAGTDRLFISPDGQLALLPFEALHDGDGKYLLERFTISYVGNGRDLLPRPGPAGEPGPPLLVTDPDYGPETEVAPPAPFRRLPGFTGEGRAVMKAISEARPEWKLAVKEGRDATEEAVVGAVRPRLLYLVTHGFFLEDAKPAGPGDRGAKLVALGPGTKSILAGTDSRVRSGVALAGANRWKERAADGKSDGLLTALEVQELDLWGTELVVLSSCETGLGEVQVGEGVLGLRRAFQQAGARTVVASLWRVPDEETEQLMTSFTRRWLAGKPKAEALRAAQLEMIEKLRADRRATRKAAPPYFWAGFICHGQP